MNNYQTPADGRLWVPSDDVGNPKTEQIVEAIESLATAEPLVASNYAGKESVYVQVDECYLDDGTLNMSVILADWFVSLQIPLHPSGDLRGLLNDVNRAFDIATRESGYYLSNADVSFVDTFIPDGQGRVTLGREYAAQDVRLIGSVTDDE